MSDDYLKFIKNLKKYFAMDLKFVSANEAHRAEEVREYVGNFGKYPIGRLGDIDIHFLHETNENEACEKWNRRKRRIEYSRVILKMSQQNLWKDEYAYEFDKIDFPNKLLFTVKNYNLKSTKEVIFKKDQHRQETQNEIEEYRRYMKILEYINDIEDTSNYFEE